MAKAGFWLRGARGKLAGASLQKGENGTIMREIVTPNNPKTLGQAIQRLAFSTAVRTAKSLEMIVDHSFEGIKYGATSVRHFTKLAVPILKAAIMNPVVRDGVKLVPALPLGILSGTPLPMVIARIPVSSGSLPGLDFGLVAAHDGDPMPWATMYIKIQGFDHPSLDFTIENLKAAGVDTDAQITILFIDGNMDVANSQGTYFNCAQNWGVARINFKSDAALSDKLFVAGVGSGEFKLNTAVLDLQRCTNATSLVFNARGMGLNGDPVTAAAVITSKFVDGDWKRSTSYITSVIDFNDETGTVQLIASKAGYNNLDDLVQAYLAAGAGTGDRYLNQETNSDIQYNAAEEEEEEEEPEP